MSVFKRSFLYITRQKRKSLILFLILWLVATALISALAVRSAGLEASRQFSAKTASTLHIESNQTDAIGDGYGSGEIPEKAMQAIAKRPDVERVSNSLMAYARLTAERMVGAQNTADMEQVLTVFGNSYSKPDARFTSGMISLKEGRHIEPGDRHAMLLHENFAKANNLKVGSKIRLGKDPMRNAADKGLIEATVVGIFSGRTTQRSEYPYEMIDNNAFSDEQLVKDLYGYAKDRAFYSRATVFPVKSADMEALKAFIKQQDINWGKYRVSQSNISLITYVKSIEVLNRLIQTMQSGVVTVAVVLVTLALFFWIGGRTHETGILLSIGQSKLAIVTQYALEVLLIAFPAFALSALTGRGVGQIAGNSLVFQASRSARMDFLKPLEGMNLGMDSGTDMLLQTIKKITVRVSAEEILQVFLLGTLVILVAVICTSLLIARYRPREILSKMS